METEGTTSSWSHDPAQLNVPSPLAIPFLLANAHLNQPALNSAKIPLQKPDTQRCPFFNPTSSIHSPPFPSLCLCFIYRQWILNSLRTFLSTPGFPCCRTLSDTSAIWKRMLQTRQTASEIRNIFLRHYFSLLDLISAHFHCTVSSLFWNPSKPRDSRQLLEILSASYIFHLNIALREPVGGIQKSSLWFSDACPL